MRKPSQHSVDLYNELVRKQNKIRKTLKRIHKKAEEMFGAGRLPALIVPKRGRSTVLAQINTQASIEAFWRRYRQAKELFAGDIRGYLSKVIKQGYMELWRDQIGIHPEGYFMLYTKEQIENSKLGDFMETYNRLQRMSSEMFLAMLYAGKITAFKYIYQEMQLGNHRSGYSYLEQQNDLISTVGRKRKEISLFKELSEQEIPYQHKASSIKKAERLKKNAERRK